MPLTWYTVKGSNSFGHGSSKNTHQVRWTNFTDGFDTRESRRFGGSNDPDDYVILSILFERGSDRITKEQLKSLYFELKLQDEFAKDGRAVPVVALRLIIDGNPQISYGIDDILQAILDEYYKDPLFPNITQCVILMRRCKFHEIGRRKQGQTVRIGDKFKDPDDLIKALDELIWYIAGNNLVLTDGKLGNYCIYNDILVAMDFDRKYALSIKESLRPYAVRYMAFMFAFAGRVYKDERLDDFRRKVLEKYNIALPIVNTTTLSKVRTEVQLNGLYNAFNEDSRKRIKHYLARDFADPVKHIFSSFILPLFTTPAPSVVPPLPPAPSVSPPPLSTKKRSHDDDINYEEAARTDKDHVNDDDEEDQINDDDEEDPRTDPLSEEVNGEAFDFLAIPSANLGGRSRKMRKRRPKPKSKSKKTRRKRSLVYHNLTR
jgi:hypothetical protein